MVKLTLRIDGGTVCDVRVKTFGCAAAIASSSALTELIKGRAVESARAVRNTDVVAYLGGLPDHKVVCSVVAEDAIKEAFR
jgi:NifU-like protein involved in Fe-S cluster formation